MLNGYTLIKVPSKYISFGNMGSRYTEAYSYYEENVSKKYTYRGVQVSIKEQKNLDFSHRSFVVTKIHVDGYNKSINHMELRNYIDGLFSLLASKLQDRTEKCSYKLSNCLEDHLYQTAIDTMISKRYTIVQKRYILNDLICKGLKQSEALDFLRYI